MPISDSLFSDLIFSLGNISALQVLDLALVTIVFYALLQLLRRARATVLLRGTLVVAAFFFFVSVFFPLPTFDYVLQLALIAILVATPIIFQPELRRLLEELGRRVGPLSLRRMTAETTLKPLARAVESLSEKQTGALVVLEGNDDLGDIIETGVPVGSRVTSELLQTLFFDGTPLHDGAVVIRADRVVAAGCVLPVSNRHLYTENRRLGTRHRAAVGLTEISDALVLVVSEETGAVSVARDGRLDANVERTTLREQIHSFYQPREDEQATFSFRRLIDELREELDRGLLAPQGATLASNLGFLVVAVLLALTVWVFVQRQTNPIGQRRVENVPLRVEGVPEGMQLVEDPHDQVAVVVKAPDDVLTSLNRGVLQAQASFEGLGPGLQSVPIAVDSGVHPVEIVSVDPPALDVELVQIVTSTVDVRVELVDEERLSPALEIRETPQVSPTQVMVTGPAPVVGEVENALAEMPVPEATGSLQRLRPLVPVDREGNEVDNVSLSPSEVQVSLTAEQRSDALDVGVDVQTENQVAAGYRLSRLDVSPQRVTLVGSRSQLDDVGSAVLTLPVNLSQAVGNFRVQVPLDLPPGVEALDSQGKTIRSALVQVEVMPRMENQVITRQVRIVGSAGLPVRVEPPSVDLTLHGPVPTLQEIAVEPRLVRVIIEASDLAGLEPGQTLSVTPRIIKPDDIRVQAIPPSVRVVALE